jgi:hypothetical protein
VSRASLFMVVLKGPLQSCIFGHFRPNWPEHFNLGAGHGYSPMRLAFKFWPTPGPETKAEDAERTLPRHLDAGCCLA